MKVPKNFFILAAVGFAVASTVIGQSSVAPTRNNPYSPSPSGNLVKAAPTQVPVAAPTPQRIAPSPQIAFVIGRAEGRDETRIISAKVDGVGESIPPSPNTARNNPDIYRVGVGDVLYINLKNSAQGSGFYTVRSDGVIDYPLAGTDIAVANKTTGEVAAMLRSSIKLFANPQIDVRVQHYLSRSYVVEGLADNAGEKALRRDAMPIFAVRAESEVRRTATTVRIRRAGSAASESYDLSSSATDNVLIHAGDTVAFVEEKKPDAASYTFAGTTRPLRTGTKLSQVISNAEPKRVVLRRGAAVSEHDIKAIRKGKEVDPILASGDVIELEN